MKTEVVLPEVPSQWLDEDGLINDDGRRMLAALIEKMPPGGHQIKDPQPNDPDVFAVYMAKAKTAASVELVLRHQGRVLLTFRNDRHWTGWHFPGTYIAQGEGFFGALNRCAQRELGLDVQPKGLIGVVNHPHSPRFHDVSNLLLCDLAHPEALGHTLQTNPAWLDPADIREKDLIPPHRPYLAMVRNLVEGRSSIGYYVDDVQ